MNTCDKMRIVAENRSTNADPLDRSSKDNRSNGASSLDYIREKPQHQADPPFLSNGRIVTGMSCKYVEKLREERLRSLSVT